MEGKLHLCVLMLHVYGSLAVWQNITVMKGRTLKLRCPIKKEGHNHPVEWRNPDVLRDKRYSLFKISESESIISISNVTFSDRGRYTCSHYLLHTVEKTMEVTVLDRPQMDVTSHKSMSVIKCAAEGNYPPPEISWQIKNGPELHHDDATVYQEGKKYVTIDMLYIKPAEKAILVKCIARHPALHSRELINFIRIRPLNSRKNHPKTKTSLPQTTPSITTTGELHQISTREKVSLTTVFPTIILRLSTEMKDPLEATTQTLHTTGEPTSDQFTRTEKDALTTEFSTTFPQFSTGASTLNSTTQRSGILNTTGNWLTSASLSANISFNETKKSHTEDVNNVERQQRNGGNAALLVFLITCLMLGLLVVIIFIGIKLRRAHIIWKRENDDTDTSEASSKSKSSPEEKNTQRRRGFFNTGLTQYVIQEPTVITSVTNPIAMICPESMANEQTSPTKHTQATPHSKIKETEL